jgi:hypothetical protein
MAGGIPRARVFMPLLNRVFKGTGDKYLASSDFWRSDQIEPFIQFQKEVSSNSWPYASCSTACSTPFPK